MAYDEIYRIVGSKSVAVGTAGGAVVSTAVMGTQTHAIDLVFIGLVTSTSGVRYAICDVASVVVNSTTSPLLPPNWVQRVKISAGQVVAALGNDGTAIPNLTVIELAT